MKGIAPEMYAVFDYIAPDEEAYAADDDERTYRKAYDGIGDVGI